MIYRLLTPTNSFAIKNSKQLLFLTV